MKKFKCAGCHDKFVITGDTHYIGKATPQDACLSFCVMCHNIIMSHMIVNDIDPNEPKEKIDLGELFRSSRKFTRTIRYSKFLSIILLALSALNLLQIVWRTL